MVDLTFQKFVDFLDRRRDEILSSMIIEKGSETYAFFSKVFGRYYTETSGGSDFTTSVAASDSSEFVRELYNGRKIILARGYSIFENSTYSSFFSEVTWVARDDLRTLTTMLMEDCEHKSLVNLLESEDPGMILVDGSLTGRLMHGDKEIRGDRLEGFPSRYYDNLLTLLKMVAEKGTVIAFVSKSSESRSLVSRIIKDSDPVPEESGGRAEHIVDHVLIKSLAKKPGYSKPVLFGSSGFPLPGSVWTFHILPSISDLPMKIDFLSPSSEFDPGILRMIVDTLFWAYSGQKVYNIWLSKVDNMVKFRTEEVEKIYMREFERTIGIPMYETRGERRARIRI